MFLGFFYCNTNADCCTGCKDMSEMKLACLQQVAGRTSFFSCSDI